MADGMDPGLSVINRQGMAVLIHPVHKVLTVVDIHQEPQAQIGAGQPMSKDHRMVILHQDHH